MVHYKQEEAPQATLASRASSSVYVFRRSTRLAGTSTYARLTNVRDRQVVPGVESSGHSYCVDLG